MTDELHFLTIAEAAKRMASKDVSPVEYVCALLARIEQVDGQLNAFVTVTAERATEAAKRAEGELLAGRSRSRLHGIPFALKDVIDTAGIRTTGHSRVAQDRVPHEHATVVRRLEDAGAILIGKLASHEFAHGGIGFDLPWPFARNPWNTAHYTGGSSSGCGAAVAAGLVPAALGTDTGGSIRIPAGLCGVAGFKPTYGLVSRHGVIPNSHTFDHCGPLAWTVEDCALLLEAVAGHDRSDPSTCAQRPFRAGALREDLRAVRVGVLRHFWEDGSCNAELSRAMENALTVLEDLGARLSNARLRPLQDYTDVKIVIAETEIFSTHQRAFQRRLHEFGVDFRGRTLGACLLTAADYFQAQRERSRMLAEFEALYASCDVLVTIGGGPAPRIDHHARHPFAEKWRAAGVFNPFSVSGGPTLSVCIGYADDGLPLSMQVSGRPGDDETVLAVGHCYERATSSRSIRPRLTANARPAEIVPGKRPYALGDAAEQLRPLLRQQLAHAGIALEGEEFDELLASAPHVLAMARRVHRDDAWSVPPATVVSLRASE